MNQITHNNHFVPQSYLRQWSDDGHRIWAYRILVSHERVPRWTHPSVSQVACRRDLYTVHENGEEIDDFEKWIEAEFENPVQESIRKVIKDNPLSQQDWDRLARFLGAQDVRTPLNYLETTERWEKTLPQLLEATIKKSIRLYEQGKLPNASALTSNQEPLSFDGVLDFQAVKSSESTPGKAYIRAGVTTGRKLWLQSQRHLLTKTVNVLKTHKWSIVRPARGYQWFTSDHPVIKLNHYGGNNYDLKGGWGNKGTNLFMPISPRHLLFTEIGEDLPDRLKLNANQTKQFQYLIAERALRWIFASEEIPIIEKLRPRRVDTQLYKFEEDQWRNWHENQSQAENQKESP